ncbi:PREDICTED: lariat debranching enzyme-like [Vollenhovia emeryi]|uniref:lariat debranching enzyme-like n=1 Tax=Vollenhovia emeryi TaxID=411798 RepID=UPI0005F55A4E|nr:PREDICTED: lariat debranching enzyme-like [Vollenhovia emeryi]
MRIAVEGCAHGELDIIYETIQEVEKIDGRKIDLLICCGDFQATRNLSDLNCMAVSDKYKDMCTFYKYYSGEKEAPVLTIFIGGNHEASNYLQELPYGGWVAPNIYYLGYAGVVQVAGIRIAGLSGIYKSQHWMQGRYEKPPYTDSTIRSVYHIRNLEVFRLKQLSGKIDIFLSHDWPAGVTKYGDEDRLLKQKPFFKDDIKSNSLGSPPCMELLERLCPSYWFSAHLHCKFAALVPEKGGARVTKFLALDKCLPKRKFLQVLEVRSQEDCPVQLSYDLEWLAILYLTNHLLSVKSSIHYMPGQYGAGRWTYTPTAKEKQTVHDKFGSNLRIPLNFARTVKPYDPCDTNTQIERPRLLINDQTTQFCQMLGIDDPSTLLQIIANNSKDNSRSSEVSTETSGNYTSESMEISFEEGDVFSSTFEMNSSNKYFVDSSPTNLSPKSDSGDSDNKDTSKSTLDGTVDNTIADSTSMENSSEQTGCVQTEPNCKKFKRRNYSVYSSTFRSAVAHQMDKLTVISGILFLLADISAIISIAMPDWIITDVGGDTRLGLMWSCMTLYNRPQVCFKSQLQSEWMMALVCIFIGCILITATIILLVISHWDRTVIPFARWVGFGAMVLFCHAAVIFPMGFHIDEIGGQPYQLPNSHQVGIAYILFVLALWITVISELFAGKVCLPHF